MRGYMTVIEIEEMQLYHGVYVTVRMGDVFEFS